MQACKWLLVSMPVTSISGMELVVQGSLVHAWCCCPSLELALMALHQQVNSQSNAQIPLATQRLTPQCYQLLQQHLSHRIDLLVAASLSQPIHRSMLEQRTKHSKSSTICTADRSVAAW